MGSKTTQPSTLHQFNGTKSTIEDMKILNTELSYDKHMNTKNTLHILLYIAGAVDRREVRKRFYYGFASRLDIYNANRGK